MKNFQSQVIGQPTFSIVIPFYNASSTLKRCIDSIICQDFDDFEVVCVDDGSTDSSLALIEDYSSADVRVRSFSQSNKGPSAARNRGLDEARGKWVLFVDSDDFLCDKTCLYTLSAAIASRPNCELVYFAGRVSLDNQTFDNGLSFKMYNAGYQCLEDYCIKKMSVVFGSIYTQCYKKAVIDENRLCFDESLWYAEDRLFVCSYFLCAGQTIVIPNVLYVYVVNRDSLIHNETKRGRLNADQKKAMTQIESQMKTRKLNLPHLRKYIHGLYIESIKTLERKEIDWGFVFRNASTLKLKIKDVLLFLSVNKY